VPPQQEDGDEGDLLRLIRKKSKQFICGGAKWSSRVACRDLLDVGCVTRAAMGDRKRWTKLTIRYDSVHLTCNKKLTDSQLSFSQLS